MENPDKREEKLESIEKLVLFVFVTATIIGMFLLYDFLDVQRAENLELEYPPPETLTSGPFACIELGCLPGTNFIGSSSGEVYHECTSSYARGILEENRVCFPSATEAISQGYRESKT